MDKTLTLKQIVLLMVVYFGGYLFVFQGLILGMVSDNNYMIVNIIGSLLCMILMILISFKYLNQQFQIFKQKKGQSIGLAFITIVYLYVAAMIFNLLVVVKMNLGQADNQINNELFMKFDMIGFMLNSLIVAPFMEEMIFRGCIFHKVWKKINAPCGFIASGLVFGFMHIVASLISGSWNNVIYILLYGSCGALLCYPFYKSENIYASMICHMTYNLLGVLALIGM